MIRVRISKEKGAYSLVMRDHAADKLVCAAASALGLTLANVLRIMDREGQFERARFRVECGDVELEAQPKEGSDEETMHCFYVAAVGFSLLSGKYPADISFEDHFAVCGGAHDAAR